MLQILTACRIDVADLRILVLSIAMAEPQIWDRMPEESFRQFAAFALYRDLGPTRSLSIIADESGYGKSTIDRLSIRYRWRERVSAYEKHLDGLKQAATKLQTYNMAQRQAALGLKMQDLAGKRLQQFIDTPDLQATMTVSDVAKLASEGVRIERLAEGESTSNEDNKITFVLAGQSLPKWAPKNLIVDAEPIEQENGDGSSGGASTSSGGTGVEVQPINRSLTP